MFVKQGKNLCKMLGIEGKYTFSILLIRFKDYGYK